MAEDTKPKAAASELDLARMRELQGMVAAFRKTLAPKIKAIEDALTGLSVLEDIKDIMEFEGKEKFSCNITYGAIPLEVTFKVKKTSG